MFVLHYYPTIVVSVDALMHRVRRTWYMGQCSQSIELDVDGV